MAQQIHLELLAGPMLLAAHLKARTEQILHRLILGFRHLNPGQLPGPVQPGQIIGIPPVPLHPFTRFARHLGRTHQNTIHPVRLQAAAQGKPARPRFITNLQGRSGMGGHEFFDQLKHAVMFPPMIPYRRTSVASDGARLTAMLSLCTSNPMNRTGPLIATGAAGLSRGAGVVFCGSTGFVEHSMYVFMVSVFLSSVVWGVSPTTCGSAPLTRRNPRLTRKADTLFTFITSHTV
jgi:hypothetical protein